MGKRAAQLFEEGLTLNDAVVETVKSAGLTQEHVRRVIEFANTSAFLHEFAKEGTAHRVVEFHGGPADPAVILPELNSGGEKVAFDRGILDYQGPPPSVKVASVVEEEEFRSLFTVETGVDPDANPLGDIVDFREKVGGLGEHLTSELSALEVMYMDLCDGLYDQVKQASLEGQHLGDVVQAFASVTDKPVFIEAVFQYLAPRLEQDGIFKTALEAVEDLEKTAGEGMINPEHPLVTGFAEYCEVLEKLASLRVERDEVVSVFKSATAFLLDPHRGTTNEFIESLAKEAKSRGAVGAVVDAAAQAGKAISPKARALGELAFGKGSEGAKAVGSLSGKLVQYAPHAAGAALALRGLQHVNAAGQSPVGHAVKSFVPGTQDYAQKQWELQQRYGGGMGY